MTLFRRSKAAHIRLGMAGERAAARALERLGCRIVARNARTPFGELDIVAFDGAALLFVEVKTLREKPNFAPAGNLSRAQCVRNRRAAEYYLTLLRPGKVPVYRFDLVEVVFRNRRVTELRRTPDYLEPSGAEVVAEALARKSFWGYII